MYRVPATLPPEEIAPAQLVYPAVNRSGNSPGIAIFQVFALPAFVGVVLALVATPAVALVGMIAAVGFLVWWWKRGPKLAGIVLRVDDGDLLVSTERSKALMERYALADLLDVQLDIKTIQRVTDGSSAIPAMRFIDSRVAPEVDTARIVLIARDRPPLPLSKEYLAHMDATEWLGKIRVFLRKHRWLPEDERPRELE